MARAQECTLSTPAPASGRGTPKAPKSDRWRGLDPVQHKACSVRPFNEPDDPGQDDRADYRDDDGVNHATLAGKAECPHDEAAHNGADYADDDVHNGSEAGALHDFAGDPACDQTYDNPPKNKHVSSLLEPD